MSFPLDTTGQSKSMSKFASVVGGTVFTGQSAALGEWVVGLGFMDDRRVGSSKLLGLALDWM